MENIQTFLNAAVAYGVPRASLFQTVDLYELRNMPQVLNTLLQLGTEVSLVNNYIVIIFSNYDSAIPIAYYFWTRIHSISR